MIRSLAKYYKVQRNREGVIRHQTNLRYMRERGGGRERESATKS